MGRAPDTDGCGAWPVPPLTQENPGLQARPRTTDAVVVADARTGRIIFSNRLAQQAVGRRVADIADHYPIFHMDGRRYAASELQLVRTMATGEEIVDEEFLFLEADRSRSVHRCTCSPLLDKAGGVVAAVAVTRDVTQQREDERRLAYLGGLLDQIDEGVVAFDPSWFVTLWSPGAERMYGWTAKEALGRHATGVTNLAMSGQDFAGIRRATADEGRWKGELIAYRKGGRPIEVELTTLRIRDRAGWLIGFLAIHRDVSQRRRMEGLGRAAQRRTEVPREVLSTAPIRLLLVEDPATVREALARAFQAESDLELVGQAASMAEARGLLAEVEIAIIDLILPDGFGGNLIRELHRANRRAQAIALSADLDRELTARAVDCGAAAAIDKAAHLDEVVQTVRRLHAGETVLPDEEVIELLRLADRRRERDWREREAIERLTPRELDVLQALADGLNGKEVAARLQITLRTERNHVANILAKLGVHSQLQAVIAAVRHRRVTIR
jgi:PAS domain S-box-containing protein